MPDISPGRSVFLRPVPLGNAASISIESRGSWPRGSFGLFRLKRLFGLLAGAAFTALLLLPFAVATIAAALASIWADGWPPLFRQKRVGMRGRIFEMIKIRTMVAGPGPSMTLPDDPRVTRVGRVLRALSLDEVPQILNVAMGELDLVGPRPDLPCQVAAYSRPMRAARLSMRPGITGLAQVFGRSLLKPRQREAIDIYYAFNRCVFLDLLVIVRTIVSVAGCRGSF